jgi:DNA-binding winged helix-turn-helix (wHTH) protein
MTSTAEQQLSPVPRADLAAITFGPFRLDPGSGRLWRGRGAIPLRPKTWAVLLHLAARPGVLVSRDELLDAIWPDTAVTPDTLNKSIGELRIALGDDRRAPRFIETVHRRGFRFVAETQPAAVESAAGLVPAAPFELPVAEPHSRRRPFVGREDELRFLAARFAKARAGERQIVFVTGPAGVGKTALVDAFLDSRSVCEGPVPVWVGRAGCIEQHGLQEAYMPFLEALERLVRPPHVERLLTLMRRAAPLWLAQMPWLVGEADAAALRHSLQGVRPERMPRELAVLIEALTTDLTLVLVLEDLHWSDPSTVDLLALLAQRREPSRLLVIATYRPADAAVREHILSGTVQTLHMQGRCAELPLHDLNEDAVRAYLALRFPGSDFPSALARLLHEHTGGQPLFLVAVIDHMLSRGWILDTAPGWGLSTPPQRIDLGVPDDVRRMVEMQVQCLSPIERGLLEAASLAGNEIVAPLLAVALGCEIGVAEQHCEMLARGQQFLVAAGTVDWPDGGVASRYAFTHELYRQVVDDEIPEGRRTRLYQRLGETLETVHGERADEIAPQLATHFLHGRDPARAVHYLIAAGRGARRRFANREAIAYLETALVQVDRLPDAEERRRRELEVRLALGRSLGDTYGFGAEAVRENYERASVLCAAPAQAAQRFEALYARWYLHALRAERDETLALAAELAELAARLGTVRLGVLADSVLVRTAFYVGRFADARRHMESLRVRPPESGDAEPIPYGVDPVIAATTHSAAALWFLGDAEAARASARAGLARAEASDNPFFLAAALGQTALVHILCGDNAQGAELAAQAESLSAAQGFALWNAFAAAVKGWAWVRQGRGREGTREIDRALAALQATGTRYFLAYVYAFLAEGHLRAGTPAKGLAAAEVGLTLSETTLDCGFAPELWRLKGELLLAAAERRHAPRSRRAGKPVAATADSDWPAAEQCLMRALEMSRAAEAKALALRAATSLARAWQTRGRSREARAVLKDICAWFGADRASADLVDARAVLGELSSARASMAGHPVAAE